MSSSTRFKLSALMFLQYFIWGTWYVTMGPYLNEVLKFNGQQIGLAYGATALAAIVSPFFVGMIADRFFATEKIMAVLHLLGAVLLLYVSTLADFSAFYPILLIYTLCYMPTLALANSLSFRQMTDPGKEFPGVRVLGTIGWIVAGYAITLLGFGKSSGMFLTAAAASAVLGVYSLALPHTPPVKTGGAVTMRDILGLDALALMKERSFAIFVLGSFLICIPLQFYYGLAGTFLSEIGVANVESIMPFGQWSELGFMLLMPVLFARLGVKWMLIVGMIAWTLRYTLFALGDAGPGFWMLLVGILLHGICYDFFFVTGQIYVDRKAPPAIRAQAQGFLVLITYGIGMLIGTQIAGWVFNDVVGEGGTLEAWQSFWWIPAAFALAVALFFALAFRDDDHAPPTNPAGHAIAQP